MSRHRFCPTNDCDGFIEELAQELWEEQHPRESEGRWSKVEPSLRQQYLDLAADTLRFLEHGHG